MKRINVVVLLFSVGLLTSCYSVGPDGRVLYGIRGERCADTYKQTNTNYDLTIDIAEQAKATGKITQEKLIDISEAAANYRAQAHDLCNFFYDAPIRSTNKASIRTTSSTAR